ncbi:MAG: terminase small subunit [Oscillospiraceae bacterium]|jgi:hypothetical protein|nr:terminase small subunit [Oscillospiraceae bacterium]
MNGKNRKLVAKEILFCQAYRRTRNGREAAAQAGYALPQRTAGKLLARPEIRREIAREDARGGAAQIRAEVEAGFRRLAFGAGTDALGLLFAEQAPGREELERLDIFNVSEIKRPKGGGLEIKFFDRMKAMEKLCAIQEENSSLDAAKAFYEALGGAAPGAGE